jgi:hypothetical protein
VRSEARLRFAVSFIRLLFNNSEEVKRIRFSQAGFVWVVIALSSFEDLSPQLPDQAIPMSFSLAPSRAQGYRVK